MDTGDVFDPNCPTRVVLDRIGDKWSVLVLLCLIAGPMRFTQLRARIGGVTPKVLTQTLRAMEQDGLLTREVFAEVPPRVEYTLTDLGRSLHDPISVVATWAEQNVNEILRCREKYS
ncbi:MULTISPECIES: winged helix-turn-helix transcriptional regulator [unclassified Nonomuraea]|uniref:winged helix-turn-helix transcriptional regulator n=1 Tax=unclassified Nonomuraea TaxID=2593643 RepID=UPI0035C06A71